MNSQYSQYFNHIAQQIEFDIEKYIGAASITLNTTYYVHKAMLKAYNFLNGEMPHLCMTELNDVAQHAIKGVHYEHTDFQKIMEIGRFSQWYAEVFMPAFEEAKTLSSINIETLAQYQGIFDEINKWFNFKRFSGTEDFIANEYSLLPTIYHTNNIKRWLLYCEHIRETKEFDDTQCYVSTCIRQDKIDNNFSAFYFAFITKQGIWLINDEINFREFHTKMFTRKPARHREEYFATVPLPHALLFDQQKFQSENTHIQTLPAILSTTASEFPVYQFEWSQFDECEEFVHELIKYVIAHHELLNKEKQLVEFMQDSAQKLLGTGTQELITTGYIDAALTYLTNDLLHAKGIDADVNLLPVVITEENVQSIALYDPYQLAEKDTISKLSTYIARRQGINNLRRKLKEISTPRVFEDGKLALKELYKANSAKILQKLFLGKRTNILQEVFKKASRSFDSNNEKLFIIKQTQQFVFTENEYRRVVTYVFPTINFSPTIDYGHRKDKCVCQHCINTNHTNPSTAHVHMFVRIQHYRELMWLFDLTREELPLSFRTYANSRYDLYVGNSILDDVDPASEIYANHKSQIDYAHGNYPVLLLAFAVCKRCYTALKKQAPDVYNIEIDYELLPSKLILGRNQEYNKIAQENNARVPDKESYNKINLTEDL